MNSNTPNAADDLLVLEKQEKLLHLPSFDANAAWALGSALRAAAMERKAGCSAEIELAGHLLFACATPGATAGQANWIRRKRNTVHHFARSTYAVGRKLERDGGTLMSKHALSEVDYAAHGGGFPLWLAGTGPVGSIVFSGLPQREDHNIVVEAMSTFLGIDVPRLG